MKLKKIFINISLPLLLIFTLDGCRNRITAPYIPAYTEKRSIVESKIKNNIPLPILILPFVDNRGINNPYDLYRMTTLVNKTVVEYLHDALYTDLKMMGFDVIKGTDSKLTLSDIESGGVIINDSYNLVLSVKVNKYTSGVKERIFIITPYSKLDYSIEIFDNTKSEIIYRQEINKKIMGEENQAYHPIMRINNLLNEDLSIMNINIAEILADI